MRPSQNPFHVRRSSLRRHALTSRRTRPSSDPRRSVGQRREQSTRCRRSREKSPICGGVIVEFEQGPVKPFALSDKSSAFVLQLLYATIDFSEPLCRLRVTAVALN